MSDSREENNTSNKLTNTAGGNALDEEKPSPSGNATSET